MFKHRQLNQSVLFTLLNKAAVYLAARKAYVASVDRHSIIVFFALFALMDCRAEVRKEVAVRIGCSGGRIFWDGDSDSNGENEGKDGSSEE